MRYFYVFLSLLVTICLITSCKDEDSLTVDSLSADGNEFYCNQKVKVWMCVNSSDLWHTTYKWTCSGGSLTQPQGLNEETWQAPSTPGTYTITCEASVGGKKEVRTRDMYVSGYFFEKFEKSSQTSFTLQNAKSTLKSDNNGNQYLMTTVNSSTEPTRYLRHTFNDDALCIPFSVRAKLGFDKYIPTTQIITVGKKSANAVIEYRWNMRSDVTNENNYINYISLQWYPHVPVDGYPSLTDDTTVEGTSNWNIQLAVQHTAATAKKTTVSEYHYLNTMNIFKDKEYHTIAMGVNEDEILVVYIDGIEVLTSTIVKDVRSSMGCKGRIYVANWEIYQLNGIGARNLPQFYLDDAYASNAEMLK